MEKDIGKIKKNDTTDIIIRVDDYKGKKGLTIREYVTSERYTGFTRSGVRISSEDFFKFREMINSINHNEFLSDELKDKKEDETEEEGGEEEKSEEVVKEVKEKKPRKIRKAKEEVKVENIEVKEETINEEEMEKE